MLRKTIPTVVVMLLLCPGLLLAGGPPFLCLPIEGVDAANADACKTLLADKLDEKMWDQEGRLRGIRLIQRPDQWYMAFYMDEDVRLSEIESALKGSEFSIDRDRLRLFGHVILELEGATRNKELLADLEALDYVSVDQEQSKRELHQVTVDMPYPAGEWRPESDALNWNEFRRNDLASDQATKSESPATADLLPSIVAFSEIAERHNGSLKDILWSINHACRPLGGVAPAGSNTRDLASE